MGSWNGGEANRTRRRRTRHGSLRASKSLLSFIDSAMRPILRRFIAPLRASMSTTAAPAQPEMSWSEFLAIRKARHRWEMATTIPSTIICGIAGGAYFFSLEGQAGSTIMSIDPLYVYAAAGIGSTGQFRWLLQLMRRYSDPSTRHYSLWLSYRPDNWLDCMEDDTQSPPRGNRHARTRPAQTHSQAPSTARAHSSKQPASTRSVPVLICKALRTDASVQTFTARRSVPSVTSATGCARKTVTNAKPSGTKAMPSIL